MFTCMAFRMAVETGTGWARMRFECNFQMTQKHEGSRGMMWCRAEVAHAGCQSCSSLEQLSCLDCGGDKAVQLHMPVLGQFCEFQCYEFI